jgi:hypothetical protein
MKAIKFFLVLSISLVLISTCCHASPVCTPVGVWHWMDGNVMVFRSDGTAAAANQNLLATWKKMPKNKVQVSWAPHPWVDSLTMTEDGTRMDGVNNEGRMIHVSCIAAPFPITSAAAGGNQPPKPCTPMGIWQWVDNRVMLFNADGSAVSSDKTVTARWMLLADGRVRVNWRKGYVDTLTLSPDGKSMDGSSALGRVLHVACVIAN